MKNIPVVTQTFSRLLIALMVLNPLSVFPQETSDQSPNQVARPNSPSQTRIIASPKPAMDFGLIEDTPVRLRLNKNLSSGTSKVDEKVDFEVIEDVKVADVVVVPRGSLAMATVTEAKPKGRLGRSGKLNVNIDYVVLASGEKVPLRAVKGGSGGNRVGTMTGAMVATGILFFPAAPLFLFMKGKNINIPKGTEITGYIGADTPLDRAKFTKVEAQTTPTPEIVRDAQAEPATVTGGDQLASVAIKSLPEGSDIIIDGKFMGNTPSTIRLKPGDYTIIVEKVGHKSWQRTVAISAGGNLTIDAILEKVQ